MSRIKRDAGILVLVVILLGIAAYLAFPIAKTKLGLDLQGGLSVVLQAEASAKAPVAYALAVGAADAKHPFVGAYEKGLWRLK